MAKMGRPKSSDRKDVSIKFDKTVADRAQMVAKAKGLSRAEYLSEIARKVVDRDFAQVMREMEESSSSAS